MAIFGYISGAILFYIGAWFLFDWLTINIAQGPGFRPSLLENRWARDFGISFVLLLLIGSSFLFFRINLYLLILPFLVFGLQFVFDRYRNNRRMNDAVNCILSKYFGEILKGKTESEAHRETLKHFALEPSGDCSLNDLVYFYLIRGKHIPVGVASSMSLEIEKLISMYRSNYLEDGTSGRRSK